MPAGLLTGGCTGISAGAAADGPAATPVEGAPGTARDTATSGLPSYIEEIERAAIQHALQKMNRNTKRMVFCISESGVLDGIVTDGDFRRWVMSGVEIDLNTPVSAICNSEFLSLHIDQDYADIEKRFDARVTVIPLTDRLGHLMAVAFKKPKELAIGNRKIGPGHAAYLIAEIGNNHNGSLELAKQLIEKVKELLPAA